MPLDIDGKIPSDSIISRNVLRKYHAQRNGAGHFILEVLSEIKGGDAAELFAHLSDNPDDHEEIWARYCERISIMRNGDKDEPTDEQKAQAMKGAINPPEYPMTDENAHEINFTKSEQEAKPLEENQIEIPEPPKDEKPSVVTLPSQPEEADGMKQTDEIEKLNAETVRKAEANELTTEDIWAGVNARTAARRAAEAKNVD